MAEHGRSLICHVLNDQHCVISDTFTITTCIDQHCVTCQNNKNLYCFICQNIGDLHSVNNMMYGPTLCQQYHVLTNIVSFLSSHLSNSIVSCGRTLETFIVSVNLSANKMRDTYVTLFVAEHGRPLLCHVLICQHFVIRLITIKACVNQLCVIWQII